MLRARYADKGWPSAATPVLDQALDELATSGHANSHLLPGPLDGDRRPQRPLSNLPEADRQIYPSVIAGLAAGLGDQSWQQLGYLSRFYHLEAKACQNAVAALQQAKAGTDARDREHAFTVLANVGFMALAQDWPDLSDAVLAFCLRESNLETSPLEACKIVRIALIAVATFPRYDADRKLDEFLLAVSARLSPPARHVMHDEILALKYLTPAEFWSLSQSEAFSAS
jgi:hypothetical protein